MRQPRPFAYIRSDVACIGLRLHKRLLAYVDGGEYVMTKVLSGVESSWIVPEGGFPWLQTSFFASTQILISTTDRRYLNRRGQLAEFLVPNAHTTYIIHALVATTVALIVRDSLLLHPLLKWVVVALVSDPLCFGLSALIRKIPYTDRVL